MGINLNTFLNTAEAAALIGCTPEYVTVLINTGEITGARKLYPNNNRSPWLIPKQSVKRFARKPKLTGRPRKFAV